MGYQLPMTIATNKNCCELRVLNKGAARTLVSTHEKHAVSCLKFCQFLSCFTARLTYFCSVMTGK